MGLPSTIRGWARSRWKLAAFALVLILAWVAAYQIVTERSRRVVRRIEALNGMATQWLRLDVDFLRTRLQFGPIEQVYLLGPKTGDGELRVLDDVPRLKILTLTNTRVSDEGLASLARFRDLNCLYYGYIDHTKIIGEAGRKLETRPLGGGKGLAALKDLPNLEVVQMHGPGTSDDDIEGFVALKRLKLLDLVNTRVTDEGVARLKKALPNCSIRRR